ncbi:MAG TPA: YbhB/YbcL family Raf kinase inhibitor-like protein, partial [Mycobacterium sp.]
MTLIGRLLRPVRASSARSPLAGAGFAAPTTITVTSTAFTDGGRIPRRHAGKGVGDDVSPALRWTGVPRATAALLLLFDDVDVPLRTPLVHSAAVLPPDSESLDEGGFRPGPG